MFTGIIEDIGEVASLSTNGTNLNISIKSNLTQELKIDQSVSHNGVCLTVVAIQENIYTVTAIKETLEKSNLGNVHVGSAINLERAMKLGDRLDGHLVQGHVDQTATCTSIKEEAGSWYYTFSYDAKKGNVTIEKGSITVNGVSLTVVDSKQDRFSVAIIPFTYKHTNFYKLKVGDSVNVEFDVVGKYLKRFLMK
ncbi:MAG: riboflavin synthase [Flavobacteriaceae bacterium CG_4_8_14_3_um_filter_34_10]|nr:riboflavin synthase [Flavobacteriia bacterium]OIP50641.1 MAG: riboflavin synthase subunit alpha [Flavobacteriaceae bacterium CG2_30_34_30]PIQ17360.1 MAG: riboflavin synthase [Flavobacteriaceae bacterium CG18_big_fil_WC_8_21_14_2_50_34_36]PIV50812.1 MAG: riboflavin synthase [Flavobacteriaceae bacterium CG02_land_8_20_14_3_00_34_13]PIX08115.1 MAG: riboflavin synthase [Flavobacteriaceae bacterium CG_4_8_14_3_um_filter_34_10]PIZ06986.1 MAG: riboflavin synthase [Flavobacteriaceae bacterium CG_4_